MRVSVTHSNDQWEAGGCATGCHYSSFSWAIFLVPHCSLLWLLLTGYNPLV